MNDQPLTVSELVELVEETFDSLMQLIELVPQDKMEEPGVSGKWSLKDILAHITWHEDQMVEVIEARALIASEWWDLPTHERNAKIYTEYKSAALQDILTDAIATHEQLVYWINTLSNEELNDPGAFEEMPAEWVPSDIIAQNTYEHYGDHAASIAKWISAQELP